MNKCVRGLSLIELMIALAIGSLLIAGAVLVYSQSRNSQLVSDRVARLQENARYVLSLVETDLQLAGYYGFSNSPDDFKFIQGGSTATAIPASQLQASSPAASGLQSCGNNFAVNLLATVEGSNNTYGLDCAAAGGGAQPATDTLTIRRASVNSNESAAPNTVTLGGRVQLLVSRLSPTNQFLFLDGALPVTPALAINNIQLRDLLVRTYYISRDSIGQAGLPALRVKVLGNGPAFIDNHLTDPTSGEVMAGVEDLQVQFGIDTGDYDADGTIDPGMDLDNNGIPDLPNGIATRYVDPNALPEGFQVVAVRIWLMFRADQGEAGFVDGRSYEFANKNITPNDNIRRVLVSRTIQLRNARTF